MIRIRPDPLIPVKAADEGHILLRQLEIEDILIGENSLPVDGLGDYDDVSLNVPTQDNLGGGLSVLAGKLVQHGVLQHISLDA